MGSKPRNHVTESAIQIAIVDTLRVLSERSRFLFFSVPNELLGRARSNAGAARMERYKRMGLTPGVADIVIVHDGRAYFLEVKTRTNKQTDTQKAFEHRCASCSSLYRVVHDEVETLSTLKEWHIVPETL